MNKQLLIKLTKDSKLNNKTDTKKNPYKGVAGKINKGIA